MIDIVLKKLYASNVIDKLNDINYCKNNNICTEQYNYNNCYNINYKYNKL